MLKTLLELQGDSTDYIQDSQLANATKMVDQDVRDTLETLEGKGFVERTRLTDGFRAYVTAKGKQALRLTEPISTPKSAGDRAPGHCRFSRWYGGCSASARSHPEDSPAFWDRTLGDQGSYHESQRSRRGLCRQTGRERGKKVRLLRDGLSDRTASGDHGGACAFRRL